MPNLQALLFIAPNTKSRILDVGSGSGQFVKIMHRFGYKNAVGIDPFVEESPARPYISRGDISAAKGTYDFILFNHSFEHLPDPEPTLRRCADLLSNNGTVVIHIPNIHSPEFAKYKQSWWGLHAPYHVAMPTRKAIESVASRSGFRVADAICTSRYDHYLYSDDYSRGIADKDSSSVRRALEAGTLDAARQNELTRLAYSLNKSLSGDWIAYYLKRNKNARGNWKLRSHSSPSSRSAG